MAFVFERIKAGSSLQSTEEYKRVVENGYGLPYFQRIVDSEKGMSFYPISINGNDERPPGKYLFFDQGKLTVIRAFQDYKKTDHESYVTVFRIMSIEAIDEAKRPMHEFHELLKDAVTAYGLQKEMPPTDVIIKFENC